jgi:hypothetical protein
VQCWRQDRQKKNSERGAGRDQLLSQEAHVICYAPDENLNTIEQEAFESPPVFNSLQRAAFAGSAIDACPYLSVRDVGEGCLGVSDSRFVILTL